jgi:aspartate kinase
MSTWGPQRPLVMKFGGSCFLALDDYKVVARYIADRLPKAGRIIAVASAMSGTTGNLRDAQRGLHPEPPADLAAQLLTTGDTLSAVLLATALSGLDVPAVSVDARDGGMSAAGSPDRARLTGIDPAPLWSALATNRVVVIPGGQATDARNRVVMLGRNSSDLSAIAAAVAVGASTCEIFSDVPGVYTADPYLLPEARLIGELGYGTASRMSRSGAKVLHPMAIELARRQRLRIVCRRRPSEASQGTVVAAHGAPVAIIADTRSATWAFPDGADIAEAREQLLREELRDEGLDIVVTDYEGTRHVVVPGGDPHGTAARIFESAVPRPDLRLLTTIRGENEPERLLVRDADLVVEARRRHRLHYPPFTLPKAGKSPLSGLLIGGALAAGHGLSAGAIETDGQTMTNGRA